MLYDCTLMEKKIKKKKKKDLMMMMMMMMNCLCDIVDRRKAFGLISDRKHFQKSSSSRISDTP